MGLPFVLVMRVLVVSNEPGTREVLGGLLRHAGDDVTWADCGPANWEGFEPSTAPHIVLIDSDTAGFDALDACRRIRALPTQTSVYTYLILLTGGEGQAAAVDRWQAVADDCLARPLQLGEVEARLRVARRIVELETRLAAQKVAFDHRPLHDVLTGIWNRGALSEHLARELDRCSRQAACVGLIMMDVDHLKMINDTHGSTVGDQVLVEASLRLKLAVRGYDGVGRYGSDEFMAVINCNQLCEAEDLADRLRVKVAAKPFDTSAGALNVTASFGVASTFGCGYVPRVLVETAEGALREAKAKGRNRTASLIRRTTPAPPAD